MMIKFILGLLMAFPLWVTSTNEFCGKSLPSVDIEAVFGEGLALNCNAPSNCSDIFWTTGQNVIVENGRCIEEDNICYRGSNGDDNLYISRVSNSTIGYTKCRCTMEQTRKLVTTCFNLIGICRAEVQVGNNPPSNYTSSATTNDTVVDLPVDGQEAVTVRCQENAVITNNCSDPNQIFADLQTSSTFNKTHPRHLCAVTCTVADHCQVTLIIHVNQLSTQTAPSTSTAISSTDVSSTAVSSTATSSIDVSSTAVSSTVVTVATAKSEVTNVSPKTAESTLPASSTGTSLLDLRTTTDQNAIGLTSYDPLVICLAAITATSVLLATCACCYYCVTTRKAVRKGTVGSSLDDDFASEMPPLHHPGESHIVELNDGAAYSELNDSREKILGDEKDSVKRTEKKRISQEDTSIQNFDINGVDAERAEDASPEVAASNKEEDDGGGDDEDDSTHTTHVDLNVSAVIYATVDKTKKTAVKT